jgi:uncharacterized membrane protein
MTAVELAAVLAAVGFLVISAFQAALAAGAPFGRASWGGAYPGRLPSNLRRASVVAMVIWAIGALIVLARVDLGLDMPDAIAYWGTWAFAVLSAVGAVVNFASSSPYERFGWGPLAAVLAFLTAFVALS